MIIILTVIKLGVAFIYPPALNLFSKCFKFGSKLTDLYIPYCKLRFEGIFFLLLIHLINSLYKKYVWISNFGIGLLICWQYGNLFTQTNLICRLWKRGGLFKTTGQLHVSVHDLIIKLITEEKYMYTTPYLSLHNMIYRNMK